MPVIFYYQYYKNIIKAQKVNISHHFIKLINKLFFPTKAKSKHKMGEKAGINF